MNNYKEVYIYISSLETEARGKWKEETVFTAASLFLETILRRSCLRVPWLQMLGEAEELPSRLPLPYLNAQDLKTFVK